ARRHSGPRRPPATRVSLQRAGVRPGPGGVLPGRLCRLAVGRPIAAVARERGRARPARGLRRRAAAAHAFPRSAAAAGRGYHAIHGRTRRRSPHRGATRPRLPGPPAGAAEPIDAAAMAGQFPEITAGRALEPGYDAVGLDWLLQRAAEKTSLGLLERLRVRDPRGEPAGWFLYYLNPGGVCQVLQVAPRPGAERLVLEHLWYQAWRGGAVALEGRVEPALLPALADQGCRLARRGAWMLCASRHPDVELAIQRGDAFLSRLEGEWWVNF